MPGPLSLKAQTLQLIQQQPLNFTNLGLDNIVQNVLASLSTPELRQFSLSVHPEINAWAQAILNNREGRAAVTIQRAFRHARLAKTLTTPLANARTLWNANPHVHAHFGGDFGRFARAILDD